MEIKIEKGIPLPAVRRNNSQYGGIVAGMAIGDSIYIENLKNRSILLYLALKNNYKFSSRKEKNGYRFWRVE